jgi:hypothetical protein
LIPDAHEGTNTFDLRVRDIVYGTAGVTGYNETVLNDIEFAIDQSPPVIALDGASLHNSDNINASGGDVIFTVTDANDTSLAATVNSNPVTLTAGEGTYHIDPTPSGLNLSDGENSFTVRATDDFGKASETTISIIVDTSDPIISVNNLTAGDILNGDYFVLRGSIDEDYGLSSVTATIRQGGTPVTGYIDVSVSGSFGWTYNIDMMELFAGGNGTGLADDTYTIQISAVDNAGNSSDSAQISFVVDQSLDIPETAITSLNGSGSDFQAATFTINHASGNNILTGVLADSASIDTTGGISGLVLTIDGDGAGGNPPVDVTADIVYQSDDEEYIPFYLNLTDDSTYADGVYDIDLTLPGTVEAYYDIIGNNVTVLTTGNKILGLTQDDDAMSNVALSLNGTDVVSETGLTGTQYSLKYSVTAGLDSGVYLAEFTGSDPNGLETTVRSLFIKDTSNPAVSVTTPLLTDTYVRAIDSTGTVTDDYAIKDMTIMAYTVGGSLMSTFDPGWTKNNDRDWDWDTGVEEIPDPYSSETISLQFSAVDFVGKSGYVERVLTLDNVDPIVAITSPLPTDKVNGTLIIRGTTADAAVETVQLRIGKYWDNDSDPGTPDVWSGTGWMNTTGTYNWTYTIADIVTSYAYDDYAEPGNFVIEDHYATTAAINAAKAIPGTLINDAVYYIDAEEKTLIYKSATDSLFTYLGQWDSVIEVLATDRAGNEATESQALLIDANTDKPKVTVIQPAASGSILGGTVLLVGSCSDDDGIQDIHVQVDVNGDGDFADQIDLWGDPTVTATLPGYGDYYFDGDTDDDFEDETLSKTTELSNGNASWTLELNTQGELYDRPENTSGDDDDGVGLTGTIHLRIWAEDINGTLSDQQELTIILDRNVPKIENKTYTPDGGSSGALTSGLFVHGIGVIEADITDNTKVDKIEVSYNNGVNWIKLYEDGGVHDSSVTRNSDTDFDLDLTFDTSTPGSPAYISGTGVIYFVIKITDDTPLTTMEYISFNIDNLAPTIALETDPGVFDPYDINGDDARIYGTAVDDKLERVLFYFTFDDTANNSPGTPYDVFDVNGNGAVEELADDFDFESVIALNDDSSAGNEEVYAVLIDEMSERGLSDLDGDTILEYITAAAGGTDWWGEFDSFNIPDGEVVLHFIAQDQAGNTTHSSAAVLIANDKPIFSQTGIGDDFDLNGNITAGEIFEYPDTGTSPIIIERMRVDVTMTDQASASKDCYFRVFHDDMGIPANEIGSETGTASDEFSFELTHAQVEAYAPGPHDFYIRARDENNVISVKKISVTISDSDDQDPSVFVFPLDTTYTDPRDSEEIENLNDDNQVRPALDNPLADRAYDSVTHPDGGTYQGHIEFIDDSLNDLAGAVDPDVSGIVTMSGYIKDNRGIKALVADITYSSDGSEAFAAGNAYNIPDGDYGTDEDHVLAYWSGGGLVSNLEEDDFETNHESFTVVVLGAENPFDMEEQQLDQNGHILYWTYKWDTSRIGTIAAENVDVAIKAIDFYDNESDIPVDPFDSEYDGKARIDIVPYITEIVRNPIVYNTDRSRLGWTPVRRSETDLQINGYNLAAYNLADGHTMRICQNKNGGFGTNISVTGYTATGTTSLTMNVPAAATSGWLRLVTGGVEAVNNRNDNTVIYNSEYSPYTDGSELWKDDRYLLVWQGDEDDRFPDSDLPQYPAMSMNTDGTLYASWSDYSTARVYYSAMDDTDATTVFYGFDPPEYTDIHVTGSDTNDNVNVFYLANYHGGNPGDWISNAQNAGGSYLYDEDAPFRDLIGTGNDYVYTGRGTYPIYRFELFYHNSMLMQFRNLRVARAEGSDQIHVTYYDVLSKSVKYSTVTSGQLPGNPQTDERPWINLDGGFDDDDADRILDDHSDVDEDGTTPDRYDDDLTRGTATGSYSAVAVDEQALPVVLFYDSQHKVLKMARANNTVPDALTDWSVQEVLSSTDDYYSAGADYITAKFDSSGILHIAYRTNRGELIYVKSDADYDGGAVYGFEPALLVDGVSSVGAWADISLQGTTPYISYLNASGVNSRDGMKMAFWDAAADTDFDGNPDGAWEYMVVPMEYIVSDGRTSIETYTGTEWRAAIGYTPGDYYRVAYFVPKP